MTVDFLLMENS